MSKVNALRCRALNFFSADKKVPLKRRRKTKVKKTEIIWDPTFTAAMKAQMVYEYEIEGDNGEQVPMVEIHVDLVPVSLREDLGPAVGRYGVRAGGFLSVRMQEGDLPIIKVGQDESIFKMYTLNSRRWSMKKKAPVRKKTAGKGNMKIVFIDEMYGFGYNTLTDEQWCEFQKSRRPGWKFEHPCCEHWVYGKERADMNARLEKDGELDDSDGACM